MLTLTVVDGLVHDVGVVVVVAVVVAAVVVAAVVVACVVVAAVVAPPPLLLTVSTPWAVVPDHAHLNLPPEPKEIFAMTVLCAFTVIRLPFTTKRCIFLPVFAILNVIFPAVKLFGETLALESVPFTATVVATRDGDPDAAIANAVATPVAPTAKSARAIRTRCTRNLP